MYVKKIIAALFIFSFLAIPGIAQQTSFQLQSDSSVRVDGDSNVRSWGADAETVSGSLTLNNVTDFSLENLTPESFGSLEMAILVESLDSGTRGLNRNMYGYLKSEDHPEITFTLNEVTEVSVTNGQASVVASGIVNAAGVNHPVTMTALAEISSDNSIRFTGEHEMLMTNFDIDPPTAVFGTVRSVDEIAITFDVKFSN